MEFLKNKYYMVFYQNVSKDAANPDYMEVGRKKIDILKDTLVWRKNTFTYTPKEISSHRGRKYYICKDYDDGKSVFQWGSTEAAESTSGIKQKNKERLMDKAMQVNPHDYGLAFVIIAAIAGIAGGALIMVVAYPSVFPEMMKKAAPVVAKLVMLWH